MKKAVRALLNRHRRPLAAVFAALAALAVAGAAGQRPHGVNVPVAARDLPAGARLRPADIATRALPAGAVPDGLVRHAAGRTLSGPVRRGEPITDARLVPDGGGGGGALARGAIGAGRFGAGPSGGRLGGGAAGGSDSSGDDSSGTAAGTDGGRSAAGGGPAGADTVATPVRLADAGVARLLRPGDRVDLLAARSGPLPARVLAPGVTVVAIPRSAAGTDGGTGSGDGADAGGVGAGGIGGGDSGGGFGGGFGDDGGGALIVLRTERAQAAAIARAAVDSRLTVSIVG